MTISAKNCLLLSLALVSSYAILGQNEVDALRYSQIDINGTARYVGVAGAFSSLGGDFASLSTNPAGIGVFRKSQFSLTGGIYGQNSTGTHFENSVDNSKLNANLGNLGLILTFPSKKETGWKNVNFGIGYNRSSNFHSQFTFEGNNPTSSLLDAYSQFGPEPYNSDPFGAELAYNTYLLNYINPDSVELATAIPNYGQTQSNTTINGGAIGEMVISFGGNYNNRLYLGATIGIPFVRFDDQTEYSESINANDTSTTLTQFVLSENLRTTGNGLNLKLGLIYRIGDYLRLGAAIHTPTLYWLTDSWDTKITATYSDTTYSYESPQGLYEYSLISPFKVIGSATVMFGKLGFLSADYELADYRGANLIEKSGRSGFENANNEIENNYTIGHNIRLGTEWRFKPILLRAGFAYYSNPYKSTINNGTKMSFTAGIGYRYKKISLDFAYMLQHTNEKRYLYDPNIIQGSDLELWSNHVVGTFAVRF